MKKTLGICAILIGIILTGCSYPEGNPKTFSPDEQCKALKDVIQKDFDYKNTPEYQENCGEQCDRMALENNLIDVFYNTNSGNCYLAQERVGVEGVTYYEIYQVQSTETGYDYVGDVVYRDNCIAEGLYESMVDFTQFTAEELEADKKTQVCEYNSKDLEQKLQKEIEKIIN